jgi:hypothetical protein
MKKLFFSLLFLFFSVSLNYGIHFSSYEIVSLKVENITDSNMIVAVFTNSFLSSLKKKNFILFERDTDLLESQNPDYLIALNIVFSEEKFITVAEVSKSLDNTKVWKDQVYTYDLLGREGLRDCSAVLADRIARKILGKPVMDYSERMDYKKKRSKETKNSPQSIEIMNFINILMRYPDGFWFDFPLAFGIEVMEFQYYWLIPNSPFGAGLGTKVVSIKDAAALSILPLCVSFPLFIYPDEYLYNRKDLYAFFEAGFLIPQFSYIDLGLKLRLNGISITFGWLHKPLFQSDSFLRSEDSTFYGELAISFGNYKVSW